MKTDTPIITIKDLVKKYKDDGEKGVVAYGGKLNVRPAFQRAFVYEPHDRDRVMQTVYNGLPLNSIYWAINPDKTYEAIDGQQRIISICQFITNDDANGNPIAINFNNKNNQTFENLSKEIKEEILNYKLQVFICSGTDDEKLDWFHTINIAGKQMTNQELLNANYTGTWLSDAKLYFSKRRNNPAINTSFYDNMDKNTLLSTSGDDANRQALLELTLKWIINSDPEKHPEIKKYMALHGDDKNAEELWKYFEKVINWVKKTFPKYRKEMKGLEWGILFNKYGSKKHDKEKMEKELERLFDIYADDPDGLNKSGFYEYVLSGDRTLIWERVFSEKQQNQVYKKQNKKCGRCGKVFDIKQMEAHHRKAYNDGGETTIENCQLLCDDCHINITAKQNQKMAKK
ncbi:MAG: DUF262 domain-containing protein [Treponema sp.]|nr:DUF262 domain-containing protein [Treponema sp.]